MMSFALQIVPEGNTEPFELVDKNTRILTELVKMREKLVDKVDEISVLLESQLDPRPALNLKGEEQEKARHLFMSQANKLNIELNKLMNLAKQFKVHIY